MARYRPCISPDNLNPVADGPPESVKQHWVNEGSFVTVDTCLIADHGVVTRKRCKELGWESIQVVLPGGKEMTLLV